MKKIHIYGTTYGITKIAIPYINHNYYKEFKDKQLVYL